MFRVQMPDLCGLEALTPGVAYLRIARLKVDQGSAWWAGRNPDEMMIHSGGHGGVARAAGAEA